MAHSCWQHQCAADVRSHCWRVFLHAAFAGHSIWNLSDSMSAPIAWALTFLLGSFVAYWWHRAMHMSSLLWRLFYQLHHSPSCIEALTAFYAHPFYSVAATFITCVVAYLGFGFDVSAAAWAIHYESVFNLYIHSDTQSPKWLCYFIKRSEMHRAHHQIGHHAQNYSLPIWDFQFVTWSNPSNRVERCGFEEGQSAMVYDMLRGKDVSS